jgi:hypothetical protein
LIPFEISQKQEKLPFSATLLLTGRLGPSTTPKGPVTPDAEHQTEPAGGDRKTKIILTVIVSEIGTCDATSYQKLRVLLKYFHY